MDNFLLVARTFFTGAWNMLTQVRVPGLEISFAGLFLGILIVGLTFKILIQFLYPREDK